MAQIAAHRRVITAAHRLSLSTPFSLLAVLARKAMRDSTDGKTAMAGGE
jgi:hypothetical protein